MSSSSENGSVNVKSFGFSSMDHHPKTMRGFLVAQITVRVLAIAFSVVAISVMVTSKQTLSVFTPHITGRYSNTSAYKFLLGVDAVLCGFTVLSTVFVWFISCRESNPTSYFFLLLHDMVMLVLMTSGCAAATAIGYVGRYGEPKVYWFAVCDFAGKLCNKLMVAVVFSYLLFFCYLILNVLGAYKLMSRPTE